MHRRSRLASLIRLSFLFGAMACSGADTSPAVRIAAPADGKDIDTSSVLVELAAAGVEIGPAGQPGFAHHHLFIDRDLTPSGETIPAGEPGIVHLGGGQSTYVVENLSPGPHTVIAVLADASHVPLVPLVSDTVRFTVRP